MPTNGGKLGKGGPRCKCRWGKSERKGGMKLIYKFINKNQLCTQIIYEEKNFKIFLIFHFRGENC